MLSRACRACTVRLPHSLPTLFLSECCLVYLEPAASEALLAWAARTLHDSGAGGAIAIYEQASLRVCSCRRASGAIPVAICPSCILQYTGTLLAGVEWRCPLPAQG